MKKLLIGMLALVMAVGFTACSSGTPTMEEIVASAKADGANWTDDQWKDAYRNMATNVKPMMDEMKEMMELLEKDPTKAMEMAQNLETKYAPLNKLVEEFDEIAASTENGKKVAEDKEFEEQLKKEFDFPDDI